MYIAMAKEIFHMHMHSLGVLVLLSLKRQHLTMHMRKVETLKRAYRIDLLVNHYMKIVASLCSGA